MNDLLTSNAVRNSYIKLHINNFINVNSKIKNDKISLQIQEKSIRSDSNPVLSKKTEYIGDSNPVLSLVFNN